MPRRIVIGIRGVGHRVIDSIWRLGYASRFFLLTMLKSGTSLRRFGLIIREVYFTGVLSLIIILVSGLFVGMVLGLQGYETLQRYGAESAVGTMVALSLLRELGPVVAALSVCEPCRLGNYRGNRSDESDRATGGHGNDGG